MTQRQFIRLLQTDVDKAPTRWRAAERLGLSESALSRILRGKQQPSAELLERYGLESTISYVRLARKTTAVNGLTVDRKIARRKYCASVQDEKAIPAGDNGPREV